MPMHRLSLQIDLPTADYTSHFPLLAEGACDVMQWWTNNASMYRNTACIATSAQSEHQFSAAGRLISRLRLRLDHDNFLI